MEKELYNKMKNSLEVNRKSFKNWLKDFLIFSKTKDISEEDYINSFNKWELIMKDPSYFESLKADTAELLKYVTKKYIYYYCKECSNPKEMTNLSRLSLDTSRIVDFFNMNFFDVEDKNILFLGFLEALYISSKKLNIDIVDITNRFFHIYFSNFDYSEIQLYGPYKTRFFELYKYLTNQNLTSNPNGTLNISDYFYSLLTPNEGNSIKELLNKDIKPLEDDYLESIKILSKYENVEKKKDTNIIWRNKDFNIIKSKKHNYFYIENKETGVVLKVFKEFTPLEEMISFINRILN